MDEIVVDPGSASRLGVAQNPTTKPTAALNAAGLPRKKPGRKPGTAIKPKPAPDAPGGGEPAPKQRRPRKLRDPNAPPVQRKRKAATEGAREPMQIDSDPLAGPAPGRQPKPSDPTSTRMVVDGPPAAQKPPRRDAPPGSMMSILNDDAPPQPRPSAPATTVASTRQIFDPVRSNYDPVRETMVARDPYGTGTAGSPRAPPQTTNRASASPAIASLVDPPASVPSLPFHQTPYGNTAAQPRFPESSSSLPPSPPPSHPSRSASQPAVKPAAPEIRRPLPPAPTPAQGKPEPPKTGFSSITSLPSATSAATNGASAPAQSKKVAAVAQQERDKQQKTSTASSSPKASHTRDGGGTVPAMPDRSILDFGKANPGEEYQAPSIVLDIPLNGETNKYINFMRMAEERYGWDALHPRLAAHRERKARIAAASAALEKNGSGRESGDEMSVDLQSDGEVSNVEMGGMGNAAGGASGPEGAPAKPVRKKRNFKEDEYDKDDEFVDDSELLWEQQAAASRDGFFVYSGPLVPEVDKPNADSNAPTKRGRGGRGGRAGAKGSSTPRGEGAGRGRGGGAGARGGGGVSRKRVTKQEKEQRDREKAERDKLAQAAPKSPAAPDTKALPQPGGGLHDEAKLSA